MTRDPKSKKVKVHFNPDNIDIVAEQGENLLQVAIAAGVHLTASCGGAGVCLLLHVGDCASLGGSVP